VTFSFRDPFDPFRLLTFDTFPCRLINAKPLRFPSVFCVLLGYDDLILEVVWHVESEIFLSGVDCDTLEDWATFSCIKFSCYLLLLKLWYGSI